jgi:HD superfamily phosphohydrolase YqeK
VSLPPEEGLPPWAQVSAARLAHIERVAGVAAGWAATMRVGEAERRRWLRAVWLHDALRDASPELLARWAPDTDGPDEMRHGPAAAARAAAEGETDRGVLDAVRYHSVGWAGWELAGWVLYCGDFLEPGRTFRREWRAEQARRFPDDPRGVLRVVATERLTHIVGSGWRLVEPTVSFWNSLVDASASR